MVLRYALAGNPRFALPPPAMRTLLTRWTSAAADRTLARTAAARQELLMTDPIGVINPEFQRGWDAALLAAQHWHESQAKKLLIQARRSRFPKNLEREAEVHQKSAGMLRTLSPDDV
jgi:hypothetical protein